MFSKLKVYSVIISVFFVLINSDYQNLYASLKNGQSPRILLVVPNYYGANYNLNKDNFENLGYTITTASIIKEVQPCGYAAVLGCRAVTVDSVLSEINDIKLYDAIVISSAAYSTGNPCGELIADAGFIQMLKTADNEGLVIGAYCTAVRVLAAADLINGKEVTGHQAYQGAYIAAGATYMGKDSQPVIYENIVTSVRGDYYYIENSNSIDDAIELNNASGFLQNEDPDLFISVNPEPEEYFWYNKGNGVNASSFTCLTQNQNKEIIAAGFTYNNTSGSSDIIMSCFDENGNLLWNKSHGAIYRDYARSVSVTNDGDIILCGTQSKAERGIRDIYYSKFSSTGELIWEKTIPGLETDEAVKYINLSDGNHLLLANTMSRGAGEEDILLIKTDNQGVVIWEKLIGSVSSDLAYDVVESSEGGFLISASSGQFSVKRDIWLIKTDANGEIIWQNSFGHPDDNDWGFSILEAADGSIYLGGKADKHGTDFYCAYLAKTDKNGNLQYFNKYGKPKNYDFAFDLSMLSDSTILLCGVQKNYETYNDYFFVTIDTSGEVINERTIEAQGYQWISKAVTDKYGNIICAGQEYGNNNISQAVIFKTTTMIPDFTSDFRTGHAPLDVKFRNTSRGKYDSEQWYYDISDHLKSPEYKYNTPGEYSVKLTTTSGTITKSKVKENYISVFDGESCLYFGNENQKILFPLTSNYNNAITFECWLNPDQPETTNSLLEAGGLNIQIIGNSLFYDNCVLVKLTTAEGEFEISTKKNSINFEEWQHVGFSYHKSGNAAIYINGTSMELKIKGGELSGAIVGINDSMVIGNNMSGDSELNCYLDEIRLWNIKRTDTHVNSTYDKYLFSDEDSLQLYLKFNEGNGNKLLEEVSSEWGIAENAEWKQSIHLGTAVDVDEAVIVENGYFLMNNYPNPFNPSTTIEFYLQEQAETKVNVFNLQGQLIVKLIDSRLNSGRHKLTFNGENLSSGIYFVVLQVDKFTDVQKITLLK